MNKDLFSPSYFFANELDCLEANFVINDIEKFNLLAEAVKKWSYYIFSLDNIIDQEVDYHKEYIENTNTLFFATSSLQSSIFDLLKLFTEESIFWLKINEYSKIYFDGLLKEKVYLVHKNILSLSDFQKLTLDKHILSYVPVYGMDLLFSAKKDSSELFTLLNHISYATQMFDDLDDFNKDSQNHQWTYAQSRVVEYMNHNNIEIDPTIDRFQEKLLYISGIGSELVIFIKENIESALNISKHMHLSKLTEWLSMFWQYVDAKESKINQLLKG